MTLSFNQRVAVPSTVLFRVVDDESVLINLDSEIYFGLDDVGTRMWTELTSSASLQEAYDKLLANYRVAPEALKQDLVELIGQLVEQGLLVLTDE